MIMQKLLPLLMCVLLLLGCSDKYDDSALRNDLNDLENRVAKLEDLCKQMNTNISSLQTIVTALQNNVYVTGTTPLMKDGKEIGYTITFSKGNPITIYHGKDGQDGEDGTTPTIGVKKDTDGVYYWTLNGEFIVVDDGKIQAEGKDGTNGTNGTTPQFKIENDYWFVSYDNGTNWTQLGKATGEDGVGSDSMFSGVDYETSTDYIIFTLSNGTQIKLPTWSAFEALQRLCNETNTNLSALQTIVTALQNNDYITSVDPLTENGKVVGYTIKFAKSNPIVIYNGKDGADGNTPVISVKKDTDGIYYWTLDGEFIVVDGQKIKAQGTDGNNGADGSDGVTPKLEIREGYWWISYDNGTNWSQLGKATGEDGKDADSIKITQDENNVYFELADGTVITISKTGQSTEFIQFKDLEVKKLCCLNWDTDHDNELSYQEAATIVSIGTVFKGNTTIVSFNEFQYFNGITDISNAFQGCTNLWEITLPDNLSTIGDAAFANCKALSTLLFEPNSKLQIIGGNIHAEALKDGYGKLDAYGAFTNCTLLTSIQIPISVIEIECAAFCNCTSLNSVIFEEGAHINTIGGGGIYPYYGESYGGGAFSKCISLQSIDIPQSITKLEAFAFSESGLKSIYIRALTPPSLTAVKQVARDSYAYAQFPSGCTAYVPFETFDTYKDNKTWSSRAHIVAYNY